MKLSSSENRNFCNCIEDFLASEYVQEMKQYMQHGNTTTYNHSMMVSYYSYWICLHLRMEHDIRSVARGALLHDFFLYDWHHSDDNILLHGLYHSGVALANAKKYFKLNPIEEDIIEKHMWPLTVTKIPKYRASFVVCLVDKLCSLSEVMHFKFLKSN